MRTFIKIICILLCMGALAGLGYLYLQETKQRQEVVQNLNEIEEKANAYVSEIDEIRTELELKKNQIEENDGILNGGAIMLGYEVSESDDLKLIKEQEEKYGFQAILVIDLAQTETQIHKILAACHGTQREVIFTTTPVSDETFALIPRIQELLKEYPSTCEDTNTFLLRDADYTDENQQKLLDHGFTTLIRYSDHGIERISDEAVYLDYNYVKTDISDAFENVKTTETKREATIYVFDLKQADLTEDGINNFLDTLTKYMKGGKIQLTSVKEARELVDSYFREKAEKQAAYDAYVAEKQGRIEELEQLERDIYQSATFEKETEIDHSEE